MKGFHIDGDFPTGKECEHHCSPSCHPAQVGPEWVYGPSGVFPAPLRLAAMINHNWRIHT